MNNLTITQNNIPEPITYAMFKVLYNTVKDSSNRENFNITGNIQTLHVSLEKITYMTTLYPGLSISSTGNVYIDFETPAIKDVLVDRIGTALEKTDGELSIETMAALSGSNKLSFMNSTIEGPFNEFKYFTGLVTTADNWYQSRFQACNITEVTLPSQVSIMSTLMFLNAKKISKIKALGTITKLCSYCLKTDTPTITEMFDFSSVTYFGDDWKGNSVTNYLNGLSTPFVINPNTTVIGATGLSEITNIAGDVNLPYLTTLGVRAFSNSGIVTVTDLGSVSDFTDTNATYGHGAFAGCTSLQTVIIPSTFTSTSKLGAAFSGCTSLQWIKFLGTDPPIAMSRTFENVPNTCIIYVPDGQESAYETAFTVGNYSNKNWSIPGDRIKGLSQFPTT